MANSRTWLRYFWRPVPDEASSYGLVRHVFFGIAADSGPSALSVCERTFALAKPSEFDWIHAPTCPECNETLKQTTGP